MDPFTHALLGAAVASPRASSRKTLIIGALGGLLPDLDVLIHSPVNPLVSIEYHRHFTHSLIFAPVAALVLSLPFYYLKKTKAHFGEIFLALFLGILSHALLDACTSYGTMLYWPVAKTRVALDAISIVDPIITGVLLWSMIWTWIKQNSSPATWALFFMLAYFMFGKWQHSQALEAQTQLASLRQQPISHGRVMPTLGNVFVWRSVYLTGDQIQTDMLRIDPRGLWHMRQGTSIALLKTDTLQNQTLRSQLELFKWFADGYIALFPGNIVGDMRYSDTPEGIKPLWGLQFNEHSTSNPFRWKMNRPDHFETKLKNLWQDITSTKHLRPLPKATKEKPVL